MSVAPSMKGQFHLKQQSAVGTAVSSFADVDILWANAMVPSLAQETIRSEVMRPGFGAPPITAGNKEGDISIDMPVHGWSSATPSGNPTQTTDMLLALLGFGDVTNTNYQATLNGGTASAPVGVTQTTSFPLLYELAVAGTHGHGWSENGTDLAVDLVGVPAVGPTDTAYGAKSYPIASPGIDPELPLTLQWLGSDSQSAIRFYDMLVSSLSYTFDSRMQPRLSATLRHLNWINDGTGGAPSVPPASAVLPEMPVAVGEVGARLIIGGVEHCVGPFGFSVTNTLAVRECHGASELLVTNRVVTVEFTGSRDNLGNAWTIGTELDDVMLELSTTPGRGLSLFIAKAVVTGPETPADRNGLLNTVVQIEAVDGGTHPLAVLAFT